MAERKDFHMMMNRRSLGQLAAAAALAAALPARAADEAPDALIKRLSNDVLQAIRGDKSLQNGDITKIIALVDKTIMPHVNFRRMTAAAVGPGWRQATPEQQQRLQEEFKTLLVRTYAGALTQVNAQTSIAVKPLRAQPTDTDVPVRTEIQGRGDPIQLDYRLEKTADGWKIYNLNVLGVWLVETYRNQFTQEINSKGVAGLIDSLAARNKANAGNGGAK
jgi:phospholipid transport system substrate-binding protein